MQGRNYYWRVNKTDFESAHGDLGLLMWISILKDYEKRFRHDNAGFVRVPYQTFERDLGYNRVRVWRWNRRAEEAGLIAADRTTRGGRTWMGYKII